MRSLMHLNKYFYKYKVRLLFGVLFIVLTNIFATVSPLVIKEIIDSIPMAGEIDKSNSLEEAGLSINDYIDLSFTKEFSKTKALAILSGFFILLYFIKGIFLFLTRQTVIVMSRLIEFDLKNEVYRKFQSLDLGFLKTTSTGDMMNRISEDVSKVRMYLGPAVMYTLNLLVQIILVLSFMIATNPKLSLYALTPLPFMSIAIFKVSSIIHKKSSKVQKQQSKLSSLVQETFSGIRTIKTFTREKSQSDMFSKESDIYKMKTLDLVKTEALFMPIIILMVGLSSILTIYVGGKMYLDNEPGMTMGTIFAFIAWIGALTWPFASVGWITSLVQQAAASQGRINEFLKIEPEITNTNPIVEDIKGEIEFKNVSFAYPGGKESVLKELNFKIKPGTSLAVIGKTGSGKSTIASLLCRIYDPLEGQILVDGKSLPSINLHHFREQIGYVPQDTFLFSDSIKNNISFGVSDASEERIIEASKDADLHHNIEDFQLGYDTLLGERGINLSGGQKQRLSIARAIIKDPKLLIFDDCLSAVDTKTEEKILQRLKKRMENSTSLIISHRISSIKNADDIIFIEGGRVVEQGDHFSLLEKKGYYYDMYQKQLVENE